MRYYPPGCLHAGVFLDMFVRQNPLEVAGVVLYGSYISHSVKLRDYPVPVITMTGDQDGMCRMTRIIKDFGSLILWKTNAKFLIKTVIVQNI